MTCKYSSGRVFEQGPKKILLALENIAQVQLHIFYYLFRGGGDVEKTRKVYRNLFNYHHYLSAEVAY